MEHRNAQATFVSAAATTFAVPANTQPFSSVLGSWGYGGYGAFHAVLWVIILIALILGIIWRVWAAKHRSRGT
jgi:uncharacterized membrane protein